MDIWVARHGVTQMNVERRVMGCRYDEPLLQVGVEQAHELARQIRLDGFQRVLASPLQRARETGRYVAEGLSIPWEVCEGLKERDTGDLSGLTWAEIEKHTSGLVTLEKVQRENEIDFAPYGGQTIESVRDQLNGVFAYLRDNYSQEKLLLVTHGGNIRVLYAMLKARGDVPLHNASLHKFTI